nr:MAG TPA: hypothetical protein [Bacteriophage sp.]
MIDQLYTKRYYLNKYKTYSNCLPIFFRLL